MFKKSLIGILVVLSFLLSACTKAADTPDLLIDSSGVTPLAPTAVALPTVVPAPAAKSVPVPTAITPTNPANQRPAPPAPGSNLVAWPVIVTDTYNVPGGVVYRTDPTACSNAQDIYGVQVSQLANVPWSSLNLCDWGDVDGVQVTLDRYFSDQPLPISFEKDKAEAVISVGTVHVWIGQLDASHMITIEGVMKVTNDGGVPLWLAMACNGTCGQFTEIRAANWRGILTFHSWTYGMTLRSDAQFHGYPQVKPESLSIGELHVYANSTWGWRHIPLSPRAPFTIEAASAGGTGGATAVPLAPTPAPKG